MAKYYASEKAKYGGTTGTIIPFTRQMPSVNFPDQGNWKTYLPAGFLRCDGTIYKADLFPVLASVIGTGSNCKFAKSSSLASDSIQLPDLGSKYVRCSNATGQYLNTTLNQDATVSKVGTETKVESLVGSSATISYAGTFNLSNPTNTTFAGNPFFSVDNSGYTPNDFLTEDNFQAHGHDADVGIFSYLAKWKDSSWVDNGESGGNDAQTEGANNLVLIQAPTNGVNTPSHNHQVNLPNSTELKASTTFAFTYNTTQIPADGLQTTISLSTENVTKLDNVIAPYVLVEYIIKI